MYSTTLLLGLLLLYAIITGRFTMLLLMLDTLIQSGLFSTEQIDNKKTKKALPGSPADLVIIPPHA